MSKQLTPLPTDPLAHASLHIIYAQRFPCKPHWSILPHVHGWNGLIYFEAGAGWVEYDGQRHEAQPGDLFITRTWRACGAGHDPQRPVTVLSTGFTLTSPTRTDVLRGLKLPDRLRLPRKLARQFVADFEALARTVAQPGLIAQMSARGQLLQLLAQVLSLAQTLPTDRLAGGSSGADPQDPRIAVARQWIDEHLDAAVNLDELAKLAHLSRTHFVQRFRAITGKTPLAYVRYRRMEEARRLLADGQLTVSETAARVGFDDPYHFSRVFRRLVGMPPSSYAASFRHPFFP